MFAIFSFKFQFPAAMSLCYAYISADTQRLQVTQMIFYQHPNVFV